MATYEIIADNKPYYLIAVEFQGMRFEQTIISLKTGAQLDAQLQAYADSYETEWLPPPVEGEVITGD